MRVLLDTQAFIWMFSDPSRLTTQAYNAIRDNTLLLSIAAPWEMTIKYSLGKLHINPAPDIVVAEHIVKGIIQILPIELLHITTLKTLPFHHRDPFDRIIIAQSLAENLSLVSSDSSFDPYGVERIW